MPITVNSRKKEYQLEGTHTVKQVFKKLGLSPEAHLAVKEGELLTENDVIKEGDEIKIISVISGGQIT